MEEFVFERIQYGYWGMTRLGKTIKIKASSKLEALRIITRRKDYLVRLKNGDSKGWSLVDKDTTPAV